MFKMISHILISILFLSLSIGVSISKHFSNGNLYSVAIFSDAESCCSDMETCEMTKMESSCKHDNQDTCSCKDTTELIKLSSNFVVSDKQNITKIQVLDVIIPSNNILDFNTEYYNSHKLTNNSSPPTLLNIHSINGVFLC